MTQTLRRELRLKFHDIVVDCPLIGGEGDETERLVDALADAALEVAGISKKSIPESFGMDWKIAAGMSDEEVARSAAKEQSERDRASLYEREMGYNPLNWWSDKKLTRLLHFLMDKTPDQIETFAAWSKAKYSSLTPVKARLDPEKVIDLWPQAFSAPQEPELPYFVPDPDESKYVVK